MNEGRTTSMNENRGYNLGQTQQRGMWMSKLTNPSTVNFGRRLAQLRKASGYTQQQLADEIGATRRMIAYYESESDHPPANLLIDLARALNTTSDELLGLQPIKTTPVSSRLERQLKQIESLGPKARRQLSQLVDTFIEAEQLKKQAKKES